MFVVRTSIPVNPDQWEMAIDYVTDLVDYAQERESGTVRYQAVEDLAEPNLLRFFEQYEDATAAAAHDESDPYRRFVEALPEFADGEIETIQFETEDVHAASFTAAEAVEALE